MLHSPLININISYPKYYSLQEGISPQSSSIFTSSVIIDGQSVSLPELLGSMPDQAHMPKGDVHPIINSSNL